jgi:hypothetical protein
MSARTISDRVRFANDQSTLIQTRATIDNLLEQIYER